MRREAKQPLLSREKNRADKTEKHLSQSKFEAWEARMSYSKTEQIIIIDLLP